MSDRLEPPFDCDHLFVVVCHRPLRRCWRRTNALRCWRCDLRVDER